MIMKRKKIKDMARVYFKKLTEKVNRYEIKKFHQQKKKYIRQ